MTTTTTPETKHCRMEGCKRPYRSKGFCNVHFRKWRRGEIEGVKSRYKICGEEKCRKPMFRKGMCEEHYTAWTTARKAAAPAAAEAAVPASEETSVKE